MDVEYIDIIGLKLLKGSIYTEMEGLVVVACVACEFLDPGVISTEITLVAVSVLAKVR